MEDNLRLYMEYGEDMGLHMEYKGYMGLNLENGGDTWSIVEIWN